MVTQSYKFEILISYKQLASWMKFSTIFKKGRLSLIFIASATFLDMKASYVVLLTRARQMQLFFPQLLFWHRGIARTHTETSNPEKPNHDILISYQIIGLQPPQTLQINFQFLVGPPLQSFLKGVESEEHIGPMLDIIGAY